MALSINLLSQNSAGANIGTIYKHPLQSYTNIVYTFLACNLNQNSNCYALERINDYGTKNRIYL
jgi:hypothetical protein